MTLMLANPRGFCAGVDRAIDIVNRALEVFGQPIYVRHEVVHNKTVVDDLRNRGAVFVEELDEVPDDALVIFSAHGVSKAVQDEAQAGADFEGGGQENGEERVTGELCGRGSGQRVACPRAPNSVPRPRRPSSGLATKCHSARRPVK